MIMARKRLLAKLETVAPAVAKTDYMPVLQHVLFTGKTLVANNDRIAISTPLATEFTGGVPARALTEMIDGSRAPIVELQLDETGKALLVRLGKAYLMLPMQPADRFTFAMPKVPKQNIIAGVAAQFYQAIELCLPSVLRDKAVVADQMGITVIPNGKHLRLFSTDTRTMTHARVKLNEAPALRERIILSVEFCEQTLRLAKRAHTTRLGVGADHAMFVADDTVLFGRLITLDDKPLPFEATLKQCLPHNYAEALVKIPKPKLGLMIERAAAIADIRGEEQPTKVTIKDGKLRLRTTSARGDVIDDTVLPGHPDVEVKVRPSLLLKAYPAFDKILFTKRGAVLAKDDLVRVIASWE